jgi:hypothetical protein
MVCGFILAAATLGAADSPANGLTYLTFNRPVSLPGVTLGTGTYAFEIANPDSGRDVVLVRDRSRQAIYYLGMTRPMARAIRSSHDGAVVFGETKPNEAVRILGWFPPDASSGREFVYER